MDQADLTFVGGGVSCVAVLEQLVARSVAEPRIRQGGTATGRPLRVLIVDRGGEFGGGVPYGRSVPPGCLCNDPVRMQHPAEFAAWLHEHRERWLSGLRAGRDPAVRRWLACNTERLAGARYAPSDYDAMFVPRSIYGDFVREKLNAALTRANASRALEVVLVHGRVIGINRRGQGFRLDLEGGGGVVSRVVVLAIGSPPPRPEPELADKPGYLSGPCTSDLPRLKSLLLHEVESNSRAAVAILGGNACALEAITLLDSLPTLRRRLASVLCITGGGDLPDASPSGLVAKPAFAKLVALDSRASLDADTLFAAVRDDLDEARAVGFNALDYADPLYARFLPLLVRLSSAGRRRFAEAYGRRFKSFGRHAPPFYRRAAANLVADGLLRTERGSVHAIRATQAGFRVLWQDPAGTERALEASLVLDCRGWGYLDEASDPFLASLLAPTSALARTNGSRIGLITDEEFQTSAGLFVMGPLLAGYSNRRHTVWNLESARRIFALAPALAQALVGTLSGSTVVSART